MIYGYARVSTKGQAKDGNSLESQFETLKQAGAEKIYYDSFTGSKIDRPEFSQLLDTLIQGDKLIVVKLDRFARSVSQGIDVIQNLLDKGVTVQILNMGILDNSPTGKLIYTVLLAFAEFERDMIIQRTQEGKEIARNKGIRVDGRPKIEIRPEVFEKFLKKQKDGEMTVNDCCKELCISRSKWYKMIDELS